MSLREEREEEHSSPNTGSTGRGLGLAAAAIGVGVGAALYYFFSKRENPDSQGSSSDWQETPFFLPFSICMTHLLLVCLLPYSIMNHTDDSDSEFATTTDTSINDTGSDSVFSDDDYADDVPYLDPFEYMSDDDDDLTSEAPSDEYSVADKEDRQADALSTHLALELQFICMPFV
ncbi:unnamed protein product [Leptosia nina]|uniref:Uncharacterized protein n=1 Tax=Leptosia nina TaxID=320188 RepID=A0AAV1JLJ7_9NEOP